MMDPNADPTPAALAAWRTADLAAAQEWAAGRLERARQLGDVEILQHLGNLLAAAAARAEVAETTAAQDGACTCGIHGMPHMRGRGQCIYPRAAAEGESGAGT